MAVGRKKWFWNISKNTHKFELKDKHSREYWSSISCSLSPQWHVCQLQKPLRKHWLRFLLLSDVWLYECGSAGAALTASSMKSSFPAVSQCQRPLTTNNQHRCLPPELCVCVSSLPSLLLKCGKIAWSNYSCWVLSPVIFPCCQQGTEGVLMAMHDHHTPPYKTNVCVDYNFLLPKNDPSKCSFSCF